MSELENALQHAAPAATLEAAYIASADLREELDRTKMELAQMVRGARLWFAQNTSLHFRRASRHVTRSIILRRQRNSSKGHSLPPPGWVNVQPSPISSMTNSRKPWHHWVTNAANWNSSLSSLMRRFRNAVRPWSWSKNRWNSTPGQTPFTILGKWSSGSWGWNRTTWLPVGVRKTGIPGSSSFRDCQNARNSGGVWKDCHYTQGAIQLIPCLAPTSEWESPKHVFKDPDWTDVHCPRPPGCLV